MERTTTSAVRRRPAKHSRSSHVRYSAGKSRERFTFRFVGEIKCLERPGTKHNEHEGLTLQEAGASVSAVMGAFNKFRNDPEVMRELGKHIPQMAALVALYCNGGEITDADVADPAALTAAEILDMVGLDS